MGSLSDSHTLRGANARSSFVFRNSSNLPYISLTLCNVEEETTYMVSRNILASSGVPEVSTWVFGWWQYHYHVTTGVGIRMVTSGLEGHPCV